MAESAASALSRTLLARTEAVLEACAEARLGIACPLADPRPSAQRFTTLHASTRSRTSEGAQLWRRWNGAASDAACENESVILAGDTPLLAHAMHQGAASEAVFSTELLEQVRTRLRAEACAQGLLLCDGSIALEERALSVRSGEAESHSVIRRAHGVISARPLHEQDLLLHEEFVAEAGPALESAGIAAVRSLAARAAHRIRPLPEDFSLVLMPQVVESCLLPWLQQGKLTLPSTLQLVEEADAERLVHGIDRIGNAVQTCVLTAAGAAQHWIGAADESPRRGLHRPGLRGATQPLHAWCSTGRVLLVAGAAACSDAVAGDPALRLRVHSALAVTQRGRARACGMVRLTEPAVHGISQEVLRLASGATLPAVHCGPARPDVQSQ